MIFLYLFITFFEIGLFGFGGGYGMLSLIQHETVEHWHWLSSSEFTDIVAISQMTPGPSDSHPRFGNRHVCPRASLTHLDDTHQQVVYAVYAPPFCRKHLCRPAPCRSRSVSSRHLIVMHARELQFAKGRPVAVLHQLFPLRLRFLRCEGCEDQSHPHDTLLRCSRPDTAIDCFYVCK